jgi:hypothetical protein
MKKHDLKRVVIDGNEYQWFYHVEKILDSGKARCQVYILDPDGPAVYQTVIRAYLCVLHLYVRDYITNKIGVTVPF